MSADVVSGGGGELVSDCSRPGDRPPQRPEDERLEEDGENAYHESAVDGHEDDNEQLSRHCQETQHGVRAILGGRIVNAVCGMGVRAPEGVEYLALLLARAASIHVELHVPKASDFRSPGGASSAKGVVPRRLLR